MIKPAGKKQAITAKQRLKNHRDVMAKNGYKTVSVFMSGALRGELDRLKESQNMAKHVALDHILDTYLQGTSQNI